MVRRTTANLSESSVALPPSVIAEGGMQIGEPSPAGSKTVKKAKVPAVAQRRTKTPAPETTRKGAAASSVASPPSKAAKSSPGAVRAARSDSTVGKVQANLEQLFKLPAGSVQLKAPRGKKIDESSTIGDLRALWTEAEEKSTRKRRAAPNA